MPIINKFSFKIFMKPLLKLVLLMSLSFAREYIAEGYQSGVYFVKLDASKFTQM